VNHLRQAWAKLIIAAEDEVYYHGTAKVPSWQPTEITPQTGRRGKPTFPHDTDPDYAYATKDPANAWNYAEKAWHSTTVGHPRVFRVKPRGPVEKDPQRDERGELRNNWEGDVRSRHGFDVVGEEPMPEDMGEPEDWR
jgi:hypothetical protein